MFSLLSRPQQKQATRPYRKSAPAAQCVREHKLSPADRDLAAKLDWIRRYYFSAAIADLKPKGRRHLAYRKLLELPNITPAMAQVVVRQWDEAAKLAVRRAELRVAAG